jgi:hypothetical protein
VYSPSAVTVDDEAPVLVFTTTTFAPASEEAVVSVTRPTMLPLGDCAQTKADNRTPTANKRDIDFLPQGSIA